MSIKEIITAPAKMAKMVRRAEATLANAAVWIDPRPPLKTKIKRWLASNSLESEDDIERFIRDVL